MELHHISLPCHADAGGLFCTKGRDRHVAVTVLHDRVERPCAGCTRGRVRGDLRDERADEHFQIHPVGAGFCGRRTNFFGGDRRNILRQIATIVDRVGKDRIEDGGDIGPALLVAFVALLTRRVDRHDHNGSEDQDDADDKE